METKPLKIYTDGGYSQAHAKGGWGVVVVQNDKVIKTIWGVDTNSTSNRMELTAFLVALQYTQEPISIFTDCTYIVEGYNRMMYRWQRDNWKKRSSKPIKNTDLWKRVYNLRRDNVKVSWIKGHKGHKYNEMADGLSKNIKINNAGNN